MKRYLKIVFCLIIVFGMLVVFLPVAFSQEKDVLKDVSKEEAVSQENVVLKTETQGTTVLGTIVSVDLEASTVVIKPITDEEKQVNNDITVYVDASTIIEKGYETASLAGLVTGDEVAINYTTNEEGNSVARHILVRGKE